MRSGAGLSAEPLISRLALPASTVPQRQIYGPGKGSLSWELSLRLRGNGTNGPCAPGRAWDAGTHQPRPAVPPPSAELLPEWQSAPPSEQPTHVWRAAPAARPGCYLQALQWQPRHSLKTGHRVTQTQAVTIPNIVWSHWGQHSQSVTPQLEMTSKHRQQDRLFLSSWCPADAGCRSHGASSGAGPLEACVGVSWGCTRSAWRL